tara:strand:+ start:53 stop:475 length:423 start_codon:yes stop_codon:yes gene_type:complete
MELNLRPFHLAFPVKNLEDTKKWYCDVLGCTLGRESDDWVDFNFYGHQVVAHLSSNFNVNQTNEVDGEQVPIRHFGVILTTNDWDRLRYKLESKEIKFIIQPNVRFENSPGEQKTMFISDPSGNVLEFKCFQNDDMIFKS